MKRVSRRAWNLDVAFSMCGWRLGWSAIIGILPVVGDVINVYLSLQVIRLAYLVDGGLPPAIWGQMVLNIVIDFVLGITPILGTIAGALYKANSRNSLALEHFLKKRATENIAQGIYLDTVTKPSQKKNIWSGESSSASGAKVVDTSMVMNASLAKSDSTLVDGESTSVSRVPGAPHTPTKYPAKQGIAYSAGSTASKKAPRSASRVSKETQNPEFSDRDDTLPATTIPPTVLPSSSPPPRRMVQSLRGNRSTGI